MKHPLFVIALACLIGLALPACGDKGGGGDSAMVGTWVMDKDHAAAQMKKLMPESMHASIPEIIKAVKMSVEVKADGTWTSEGKNPMGETSGSGTWKLDGKNLTVKHEMRNGEAAKDMDDWKGTFDGEVVLIHDMVQGKPVIRRMIRK